jgi:hypothetical protein
MKEAPQSFFRAKRSFGDRAKYNEASFIGRIQRGAFGGSWGVVAEAGEAAAPGTSTPFMM